MSNRPRLEIHVSNDDICQHLEDVKAMGITQVIGDSNVAKEAEKRGLRFVLANFWTTETKYTDIRCQIDQFVGSENLVSINMMDEPIYWDFDDDTPTDVLRPPIRTPECYCAIHDQIQEEYKEYDIDLSLAFFGPDTGEWKDEERRQYFLEYFPAIEQLRMNIYPALKNCPLGVIITWLDYLKEEMSQHHVMPLTVTLQTWSIPEHPRYPTVNELRVMAYLSFLGGAHTVSFYQYEPCVWNRLPGFTERFKELVSELNERTEVLEGAHVEGDFVDPDDEVYQAQVTSPDGRPKINVTINTTDKEIDNLAPYEVSWTPC